MDLRYGAEYEDYRRELQEFIQAWPPTGPEAELPLEEQERWFPVFIIEWVRCAL